ncbi:hypothetical protein N0V90_005232 [Kalmusia sp. IMI 367209]|nr:hypothetical protein N0V90_005232 [Kalmusia sp. IMI 367209]
MLLQIASYLEYEHQWSFAMAFPAVPQLMIPVLNQLVLCRNSDYYPYPNGLADPVVILAFLHFFPAYATHMRQLTIHIPASATLRYTSYPSPRNCFPWLPEWTADQEVHLLRDSAERSGINSTPNFVTTFQQLTQYDQDLTRIAILLALGARICSLVVYVPDSPEPACDLGHMAMTAFLPALQLFRLRGQTLDYFHLSIPNHATGLKRPFFYQHRNIATCLSTMFTVQHITHLELGRLSESVCYRGDWSLYSQVTVQKLTIDNTLLRGLSLPRLLQSINGLQALDAKFRFAERQLDPEGEDRESMANIERDISNALWTHRHTLQDLRLCIPVHQFDLRCNPSIRFLTNLTRLEMPTEWHNLPQNSLHQVLPPSIHTFITRWKLNGRFTGFRDFVAHLKRGRKDLPALVHIVEMEPWKYIPSDERTLMKPRVFVLILQRRKILDLDERKRQRMVVIVWENAV